MALRLMNKPVVARAQQRTRTVRVAASQQGAKLAVAGFAAGALLTLGGPALAGVQLQQPQLKKVFQDDGSARTAAAPAAAKPAKKKEAAAEGSSGGFAPQSVALPAALVVVGGGAFALTTVDAGFSEFMRTAAVKDSSADGAGYETDIKGDGPKAAPKKAGTAKVKKAAPAKAAGGNPFSGLFNK